VCLWELAGKERMMGVRLGVRRVLCTKWRLSGKVEVIMLLAILLCLGMLVIGFVPDALVLLLFSSLG